MRFLKLAAMAAICLGFALLVSAQGKPVKVVLVYDFEGVTGVTAARAIGNFDAALYGEARKSLTADVNAAIAGLKAGGAGKILVVDGHGSGNSEGPDVLEDLLLPPARMLYRDHPYDPYLDTCDPTVDGVVGVGMHAGAGNEAGFLSHTLTIEAAEYKINGVRFNEPMILAVAAARYRVPLLMVSGDDQLQAEVSRMLPWVKCAVVKHAVSRSKVEPLERAEASRRIEAAARQALEDRAKAGFPEWHAPFRFALRFQDERQASAAALFPDSELLQDKLTVQVRAHDFEEGYQAARRMLKAVSVYGWEEARATVMEAQPNGVELEQKVIDRWLDQWLGVLPPPEEKKGQEAPRKPRYWGAK